jgi:glycosyltransferase involved in cell wall biosynthesis
MSAILIRKAFRVLKNEGLDIVFYKLKVRYMSKHIYSRWIAGNERNLLYTQKLEYNPLISVVVPVYNVDSRMLRECIDSILNQTYSNFEVILVDDASTMDSVRSVLAEYDPSVTGKGKVPVSVIYRSQNGHISRATNDGIEAARGEFVALCDCDDLYAPNALYEIAKKLNEDKSYDFIYTDEDKISEDTRIRRDPFFKPDWSPETFMSYMYTCHLSVYRKSILERVGFLRTGFEGSQDYDLVLRVMEVTDRIGHVPKILYHWRMRKESTANNLTAKPYIMEATVKAKKEALERRGLLGELELIPDIGQYRVRYIPKDDPLVSIIIPSKDNTKVLFRCLDSISEKTEYQNYEIIVVDNGSNDANRAKIEGYAAEHANISYIYEPMQFNFSRMCNIGAQNARGEYLLFLNDDIEVSDSVKKNPALAGKVSQWLSNLLGQAQVSYTGAVGCKLYYPDTIRLQHAGVLNLAIGPGHCLYGSEDNLNYYYGRNLLDYNFTVVTGACLMVSAAKFNQVNGFDEDLPVAYNDVALCFKLVEQGYYNVLRNDVALVHHESVSRGLDEQSQEKENRRKSDMKRLYEKHPEFAGGYDPCYNPNLTPDKGDFSFDMSKAILPANIRHKKDISGYVLSAPDMGSLSSGIENIADCADTIRIGGWAYRNNKKNNNHNKIKVILKNNENGYYFADTQLMYRNDIVRADGSRKGLALTGFETVILKSRIKPGRYQVCVSIGKIYYIHSRYVEVGK